MNQFGTALRLSIFGESHGAALGCTLDGLPAGFAPDFALIEKELDRRRPRAGAESTPRRECDGYRIISGFYNGRFTGAPFTVIFENADARSEDYSNNIARPSHADLVSFVKFSGANDPRGSGHSSGRLTLPIVFAGAIAKQILFNKGIVIASHIASVGDISDAPFDPCMTEFPELDPMFPLVDKSLKPGIKKLFESVRERGSSVGAICECAALGAPIGIGEPFFDGLESVIAHLVYSIPGVHALEFGAGFGFARLFGEQANDAILPNKKTATNRSGGINGGISNGMPIIFKAGFRPVPSIALEQDSIDLDNGKKTTLKLGGRHDVCILPRGLAAVEACLALALYELISRK